ncbi:MAG TPA: DUF3159 domain-containing protein [Chloroflexota bacterium]|nr:DUF3159 domain-containing protein [Chloroflexota bacterium]
MPSWSQGQWSKDDWQGIDVAKMLGGRRGVIDATTPGIVLVIVDAFTSLAYAIGAALVAAAVIGVLRLLRHEPLRQAGAGVLGLAGAAALAAYTGNAKTYFLPGILVNAAWAIASVGSIIIGRPLLGYAAAMLDRGYAHWQHEPGLRRAAALATGVWALVFTSRALVQGYLYVHNDVHWLAPVKLGMGLPLWGVAFALTLLLLEGRRIEPQPADVD